MNMKYTKDELHIEAMNLAAASPCSKTVQMQRMPCKPVMREWYVESHTPAQIVVEMACGAHKSRANGQADHQWTVTKDL